MNDRHRKAFNETRDALLKAAATPVAAANSGDKLSAVVCCGALLIASTLFDATEEIVEAIKNHARVTQ